VGFDCALPTLRLLRVHFHFSGRKINGSKSQLIFWFPRAGVGTDLGSKSVPSLRACGRLCSHLDNAFPRRRVGTRNAGAWERENGQTHRSAPTKPRVFFWFPRAGVGTDLGSKSVPSLRACGRLCSHLDNGFPRRRAHRYT